MSDGGREQELRELRQLVEAFAAIDWMSQDGRIHQIAEKYRAIDPKVWLELIDAVLASPGSVSDQGWRDIRGSKK